MGFIIFLCCFHHISDNDDDIYFLEFFSHLELFSLILIIHVDFRSTIAFSPSFLLIKLLGILLNAYVRYVDCRIIIQLLYVDTYGPNQALNC